MHAIRISKNTISNSFMNCELSVQPEAHFEEESDPQFKTDWNRYFRMQNAEFKEYVGCDYDEATAGTLIDAEMMQ